MRGSRLLTPSWLPGPRKFLHDDHVGEKEWVDYSDREDVDVMEDEDLLLSTEWDLMDEELVRILSRA